MYLARDTSMVDSGVTEGGGGGGGGEHGQFSFSRINTATQTWSLKLKSNDFQVIPEEKQQLVEEKDADIIRKVLCKSFIQWFHLFSFVFFRCCWSMLNWKSRNIKKNQDPRENKTVSLVIWH